MKRYHVQLSARPDHLPDGVRATLDCLDSRLFPADDPYPKDGCWWWLVFDGGDVVGFAGLKPLAGRDHGTGFLCRAGVLPRAAGAGLQRRLIRTRLRYARATGLRHVVTYAARHNFVSVANLIRCGLRFYVPAFAWGGSGALYFIADLQR